MKPAQMIRVFHDRYPFVGPGMWILSIQYFIIQIFVATDWSTNYSLAQNTISDLGNTTCGIYNSMYVCSPLHNLMNASFIILGAFMALGAILIYQEFKKTTASLVGFSLMSIAGVGTMLVGLFPENSINHIHTFGAFLPFLFGNIGIIILGFVLRIPRSLKVYSYITGVIALVALMFFIVHSYLDIGVGGMERIVAYPQTVWLIVFGVYISKNRILKQSNKS